MTHPLAPGDRTWLSQIKWTPPRTVHSLTQYGARTVISDKRGFYAFVKSPSPPNLHGNCLYLGIALGQNGIRGRLSSYLRATLTDSKAEQIKHSGKRKLAFARIRGFDGTGTSRTNTEENDRSIYVTWAQAPLYFEGSKSSTLESRRLAFQLERALIDHYRPIYNTADWGRDLDLELYEDAYGDETLD
jgi:hypothetical protein